MDDPRTSWPSYLTPANPCLVPHRPQQTLINFAEDFNVETLLIKKKKEKKCRCILITLKINNMVFLVDLREFLEATTNKRALSGGLMEEISKYGKARGF